MDETDPCEVCTSEQAKSLPVNFDGVHQVCPRCGEFQASGTACALLRQGLGKEKRAKISGWIRSQNRSSSVPMLNSENIKSILHNPIPPTSERAVNLLQEAEVGLETLGDTFNINEPRFMAATYSYSLQDVLFLMKMLKQMGYAETTTMSGGSEILPAGYIRLDELRRPFTASNKGFVAMSFHDSLAETYSKGFQVGIIEAGYLPIRVDSLEHINRIDDEIINQINTSQFVVADFTGHRGGVYFEAGYALGKNIPVFWTCRKDDLPNLHFDIRQFNCIDWSTSDELAQRLQTRLEAVLGKGNNRHA